VIKQVELLKRMTRPPRELKLEAAKKHGTKWILAQPSHTQAVIAPGVIVIACQGEDI
jgi:hypothetical protein